MIQWRAVAVRCSFTSLLNARAHVSQQPKNTEYDDHTSRGDTAVSSRGWLHDIGGTPWCSIRSKAAPLKSSVLVDEDGWGILVEKAGYNWLCWLVTPAGYGDWLCWLVTVTGYASWIRRLVKVMMNWSAWCGDNQSRDEDRMIGNDEGMRWQGSEVTKWSDEVTRWRGKSWMKKKVLQPKCAVGVHVHIADKAPVKHVNCN